MKKCHVPKTIALSSDNSSSLDRAITLRRNNSSYAPRAITFGSNNFSMLCTVLTAKSVSQEYMEVALFHSEL